jgi:hypothetical protein
MIRYALACDKGHEFEGWFGSSQEFDRQAQMHLVECPQCGSTAVSKMLMAPAVSTSRRKQAREAVAQSDPAPAASEQMVSVSSMPDAAPGASSDRRAGIVAELRALRQRMLEGSEDVGARFGEEARKIHYGESEARAIHGQASLAEARELHEEGIDFLPVPQLPDDRN